MLIQEFHSLLERGWQARFPELAAESVLIQHAIRLAVRVWPPHHLAHARCSGPMGSGLERRLQDVLAAPLQAGAVVRPVIDEYLERYAKRPVIAALDDTKLRKTGRKIKGTSWHRDPLSPPFHMTSCTWLRFLQASLLFVALSFCQGVHCTNRLG